MGDWEIVIIAYLFVFIAFSFNSLFVLFLNATALSCDWGGSRAPTIPGGDADAEEEKARSKMEREGGAWGRTGGAGGLRDKVQKHSGTPSVRANGHKTGPYQ